MFFSSGGREEGQIEHKMGRMRELARGLVHNLLVFRNFYGMSQRSEVPESEGIVVKMT